MELSRILTVQALCVFSCPCSDFVLLRVRSIGKSGFRFQNPDFGFATEREIRKWISTLRYLFLDFHFYSSIGKSEKGFEKLSCKSFFQISQSNGKREIRIWIS